MDSSKMSGQLDKMLGEIRNVHLYLIDRMVMKPGKVLCCMFLLTILGIDPAQNLAKYKRWVICARTTKQ